jgi:uncharacterized DUF497 family protein
MGVSFDPGKDRANVEKHRISLARAADLAIEAVVPDDRYAYGEARFRAYGQIDGVDHCRVYVLREGRIRAISLRRAHAREMRRHVQRS